jgi:hypothetical protein
MGYYDDCGRIGKHQTTLYTTRQGKEGNSMTWCILAFHLLGSTLLFFSLVLAFLGGVLISLVVFLTFSWGFDFLFLGNESGGWSFH